MTIRAKLSTVFVRERLKVACLNVHFAKNGSTCLVYEGQSSKRQELRTKSTQMAA